VDKLDTIFAKQKEFDDFLAANRKLNYNTEEWIQKEVLAMIAELGELLDEVNFKWWKNPKEIDADRVKSELIDILHFFVSMCLKVGMDGEELYQRYLDKNKLNFSRQYGTGDKPGYALNESDK